MPVSETIKLEREKSGLHDEMMNSLVALRRAVSAFHSLEDHYDLCEQTIESVDGWVDRTNKSLSDVGYMIDELEDWAFDGDSYRLMEDEDEEV